MWESNPRPPNYVSAALTARLLRQVLTVTRKILPVVFNDAVYNQTLNRVKYTKYFNLHFYNILSKL